MKRVDYYAGITMISAAIFFGQMAASHVRAASDSKLVKDTIITHKLVLTDSKGNIRGAFYAEPTNTQLSISSPDGKLQTHFYQSNSEFLFGGQGGKDAVILATINGKDALFSLANGEANRAELALNNNHPCVILTENGKETQIPNR